MIKQATFKDILSIIRLYRQPLIYNYLTLSVSMILGKKFYVYLLDGCVVGCVSHRYGLCGDLFVKESHRRIGIGMGLIEFMIKKYPNFKAVINIHSFRIMVKDRKKI